MSNSKETAPHFDEIRANARLLGEDKALASIAIFSMLLSLGAREDARERLVTAFFDLLESIRPDITPEQVDRVELYLRALTLDAVDFFHKDPRA